MVRCILILGLLFGLALTVQANELTHFNKQFGRSMTFEFPADAPYTPQKAALGKMLFFDMRLSKNVNFSCASCHNPSFAWTLPTSARIGRVGHQFNRNVPTIQGIADSPLFFSDGRAGDLETQIKYVILNPQEMNFTMSGVITRLSEIIQYKTLFSQVFPNQGLTNESLLEAIATYVRTVEPGWAPFDEWLAGNNNAISETSKRGFKLFTGKAGCSQCHSGWKFTDYNFYDIGLNTKDRGRFNIETANVNNLHAFKTPTLRNIGLRAPYMHAAQFEDLEQVLLHYVSGGNTRESLSEKMHPLNLSADEISELVAFLHTLTEYPVQVSMPKLPSE